jgi:SHS2 domain-containing protein
MPYKIREDVATADIAFEAWGTNIEEIFRAGADALVGIMIDNPESIAKSERRNVNLSDTETDMLFFDFLNEFIYFKDAEQLILRPEEISITDEGLQKTISAVLAGEILDPGRHHMHVDVKAVTLHLFNLSKDDGGWKAFVILDI